MSLVFTTDMYPPSCLFIYDFFILLSFFAIIFKKLQIFFSSSFDENGKIIFAIVFVKCNLKHLPIICINVVLFVGKCKKHTPFVIGASKPSTNIFTLTKNGISPFLYFSIIISLFFFDVLQSKYSELFNCNSFINLFINFPSFCELQ